MSTPSLSHRDQHFFSYVQYSDTVAVIFENNKALCTAKRVDKGWWEADYCSQVNETRARYKHHPLTAPDLDRLVQEFAWRPHGEWIGRDTIREPANPAEWVAANGG